MLTVEGILTPRPGRCSLSSVASHVSGVGCLHGKLARDVSVPWCNVEVEYPLSHWPGLSAKLIAAIWKHFRSANKEGKPIVQQRCNRLE